MTEPHLEAIIELRFSIEEKALLMRALAMAASKLDRSGRSAPEGRKGSGHDDTAARLRTLQARIARERPVRTPTAPAEEGEAA